MDDLFVGKICRIRGQISESLTFQASSGRAVVIGQAASEFQPILAQQ